MKTSISTSAPIDAFRGRWEFLSNFHASPLEVGGITYPSLENAYQAHKTKDLAVRRQFSMMSPSRAKRLGRSSLQLRDDWEKIKIALMRQLLAIKFAQDSYLAHKLIATGKRELIEGNTWGDRFWGQTNGKGLNWLGRLLMERREELVNARDK